MYSQLCVIMCIMYMIIYVDIINIHIYIYIYIYISKNIISSCYHTMTTAIWENMSFSLLQL